MSTNTGEVRVLGLRLFLEGLEVPVISATVDINEGAAAVAQIEIVGLDAAMRFKPRTVVHLFFFDGARAKYGKVKNAEDNYCLFFMGELFSYTYQKSGSGARSVILNCIDFSNYWDTSFIFQVSSEEGLLDVPQIQPFITGSDVFANTTVGQSNIGLLIDQLSTENGGPQLSQDILPTEKIEFLSSLMGILEMLGGVSVLDDSSAPAGTDAKRYTVHGGMSPWHTLSERRVRLLDQIATDDGKTAASMFQQDKFIEFLRGQSDLSNSVLSFRDILNLLIGHVFYSTFPNPCGRLLRGEAFTPHALPSRDGGLAPDVPAYQSPDEVPLAASALPSQLRSAEELAASRALMRNQTPAVIPEQLSANFTFAELTRVSQSSLQPQNTAEAVAVYNFIQDLCLYVLEPIMAKWGDFTINSGFRCPAVNANTKESSRTSQHMLGQAADITFGSAEKNWKVYTWLAFIDKEIPYGQVIMEKAAGTWIHVSLGKPWWHSSGQVKYKYPGGPVLNAPSNWSSATSLPPEFGK